MELGAASPPPRDVRRVVSRAALVLSLVLAPQACGDATTTPAAGSVADAAPPPDAAPGVDAGAADAAVERPLRMPAAATLPLVEANLLRVGVSGQIDVAAAFCGTGARLSVFWDRFDAAFSSSRVWAIHTEDLTRATAPAAVDLGPERFVANPSCVGDYLYFASSTGLSSRPVVSRARLAALGERVAVAVTGVDTLLGWPHFNAWGARTAVAFRDGTSAPHLALSVDGVAFSAPVAVSEPGALANAVDLGGGALLFSYQRPVGGEPMVSFFRTTTDGVAFSPEARVTANASNVHDTSALPRPGGGVDLYYIYPKGPLGFTLFRRAVSAAGALGPEETVTTPGLGEPSKPVAARAPDGTVLLAYADITARDVTTGEPTTQELTIARLQGDAPPPP
ncbi:MAG: hypothetical protein R3B36_16780 [Polyangiaceae bacterium]